MNRHEPAEHPVVADRSEPSRFHEPRDGIGARISADGRGNVAVGIGIAVQHPAQDAADNRQVCKIHGADDKRPLCGEHARAQRHDYPSYAQSLGNTAGVHRAGAAEGNEREAARIDAPPDGHGANGLGHRPVAPRRRMELVHCFGQDVRLSGRRDGGAGIREGD